MQAHQLSAQDLNEATKLYMTIVGSLNQQSQQFTHTIQGVQCKFYIEKHSKEKQNSRGVQSMAEELHMDEVNQEAMPNS